MNRMQFAGLALFSLAGLTACATTADRTRNQPDQEGSYTPRQAVMLAADQPENGVAGRFQMTVRNIGADAANYYLNSEADYRDQRSLTLRIPRDRAAEIARRLHVDGLDGLRDHAIEFEGMARRTRIDFTGNGQPTGKYYYQTHATLFAIESIKDLGPAPTSL